MIYYRVGDLIAVAGNLYEYGGIADVLCTNGLNLHKVYVIDIDEDGILTHTYSTWYFTDEELANDEISFTVKQWYGIVEHFIRQSYELTEKEIAEAVEDIVGRCFVYGVPKIKELPNYIDTYMDR